MLFFPFRYFNDEADPLPLTLFFIAMDVAYPLMVVGTAERHIQIFNLSKSEANSIR